MYYPFIFKDLGKEQEASEEEVRKRFLAEEKEESPKGKRCKIISHPFVRSTGCNTNVVLNSLLPNSLPINNFSIFKVDSGNSRAVSIPGGRKREKRNNKKHLQIRGQSKMHTYLTVSKTMLKTEDNAHVNHQHIPQQKTENSLGTS